MRHLIEILLAIVATIVVLLLIGLFLPGGGHGHVERSIIIERPPSHVFDVLNSFKRFNEWSPWAKKDLAASYTFEGPESGQGAVMTYAANKEVGSGRFEIIESTPTSIIKMIQRPTEGRTATVTFDVGTSDLGVKVTWTYDVELGGNPIERIKGKYLDSSIGGDYQYGLMRLKALIESSAYARDYSDITITQQDLVPGPALKLAGLVEVYSSTDFPDLNAGVADTMTKLTAFVDRNKLIVTGPAQVSVTMKERYRLAYYVVLPVDRTDVPMKDEIEATQSLGGQVLFAEHVGERRKSNVTFEKLQAYANIHGMPFDPMAKAIEEFLPDREAPKAADAADAAPAADAAAASTDAAAGTDPAAVPEPVMIEVTRVYLPLGLPVAPAVDPMAAPAAGAAPTEAAPVEPAPAPTGG
ncbi:MAG: SRPBCC family protein [Rhodanobacteraceae bacterium]|nr:SRPBCC family protein [Rhodanobacteraceae bacterium]